MGNSMKSLNRKIKELTDIPKNHDISWVQGYVYAMRFFHNEDEAIIKCERECNKIGESFNEEKWCIKGFEPLE